MSSDKVMIFILQHVYEDRCEHIKMLGAFSDEKSARRAIKHYVDKPGFSDYLDGFVISTLVLDRLEWTSGFGPSPEDYGED